MKGKHTSSLDPTELKDKFLAHLNEWKQQQKVCKSDRDIHNLNTKECIFV